MEYPGLTIIGNERCNNLRWKGLFVEAQPDPTLQHGDDRSFWCLETQICFGPDGDSVNETACNPSRSCYKPL